MEFLLVNCTGYSADEGFRKISIFLQNGECVNFIFLAIKKHSFFGYKTKYNYRKKNSVIHILNIDILNNLLKFESDLLSRSGDIVGTDFENLIVRQTRLKLYVLF